MKKVKEYTIITFGVLLVVASFIFFFFPNNIACGGVSGLALVLHDITGIESGIIMFVANVILFGVAFIFIGGEFGIKSIYAAFGLSAILSITEKSGISFALTNNLVLATIFGSALLAMGTAIMFTQDASTGGTSIIAKLLSKYFHIEYGMGQLISDSIVILLAMYTFGMELGLFGLLSVYLIGTLIDKFIDGFNSCKQVLIFTQKEQTVVEYINKDVDRGCTVFKGKGGYTGRENTVILTILSRRQFIQLKQFIKKEDPEAFITVNATTEVLGKGFMNLVE